MTDKPSTSPVCPRRRSARCCPACSWRKPRSRLRRIHCRMASDPCGSCTSLRRPAPPTPSPMPGGSAANSTCRRWNARPRHSSTGTDASDHLRRARRRNRFNWSIPNGRCAIDGATSSLGPEVAGLAAPGVRSPLRPAHRPGAAADLMQRTPRRARARVGDCITSPSTSGRSTSSSTSCACCTPPSTAHHRRRRAPKRYVDYADSSRPATLEVPRATDSGPTGASSWPVTCRSSSCPSTGRDRRSRPTAAPCTASPSTRALTARLGDVGRRAGATPYMTLLAAYATLLHRYSGQDDLLIGSPFGVSRPGRSSRGWSATSPTPWCCAPTCSGDPTFTSLLGRVKDTVLGALEHQDYPFALLVERLRPGPRSEPHAAVPGLVRLGTDAPLPGRRGCGTAARRRWISRPATSARAERRST